MIYPVGPGWDVNVGQLMTSRQEQWWTIQTEEDVPAITDHVVAVVGDLGLPHLHTRIEGIDPPALPAARKQPYRGLSLAVLLPPIALYGENLDSVPEPCRRHPVHCAHGRTGTGRACRPHDRGPHQDVEAAAHQPRPPRPVPDRRRRAA